MEVDEVHGMTEGVAHGVVDGAADAVVAALVNAEAQVKRASQGVDPLAMFRDTDIVAASVELTKAMTCELVRQWNSVPRELALSFVVTSVGGIPRVACVVRRSSKRETDAHQLTDLCALEGVLRYVPRLVSLSVRGTRLGFPPFQGDFGMNALLVAVGCVSELQELDIADNHIHTELLPLLARGLARMSRLTTLNVSQNSFTGADGARALVEVLQCLPQLTSLDISDNELSKEGVWVLAMYWLPCLTKLVVGGVCLGSYGGAEALAAMVLAVSPNLAVLDFNTCRRSTLGSEGLQAVAAAMLKRGGEGNPAMRSVYLQHNDLGVDGMKNVAVLAAAVPLLETLDVSQNLCTTYGADDLAHAIAQLPQLKELVLSDMALHDKGVHLVCEALVGTTVWLHRLRLSCNSITFDGLLDIVAALPSMPQLRVLDLSYNQAIDTHGVMTLAALGLQHVPRLEELELSGLRMGDDGARALARGLRHVANLSTLGLAWNSIGVTGANKLAEGFAHVPKLTVLNLNDNGLSGGGTSAVAQELQHLPYLKELRLHHNDMQLSGLQSLVVALPYMPRLTVLNAANPFSHECRQTILELRRALPADCVCDIAKDDF